MLNTPYSFPQAVARPLIDKSYVVLNAEAAAQKQPPGYVPGSGPKCVDTEPLAAPPSYLATQLGTLLIAALATATAPLEDRINELETKLDLLMERFGEFESGLEAEIEKAIDNVVENLDIESTVTYRRN